MPKLVAFTGNIEEEISYLEMFKVQTKDLHNEYKLIAFEYLVTKLFYDLRHKVVICGNKQNLVSKRLGAK